MMKKRVTALLTALILVLSLAVPAFAEGYDVEFSNINGEQTQNNPEHRRLLILKQDADPLMIEKMTTYHWNNGLGTDSAGSISIIEYVQQDGAWKRAQVCGTWRAVGRSYWALENVYWDAYPDFVMLPGHAYVIEPSDTSEWSYNESSNNQGMFEVLGNYLPNFNAAGTTDSGSTSSGSGGENNNNNGYRCSGWALDEVRQSDFLGIFPESLRRADLKQPITRAEFAGVAVNTYVRMTKQAVEPYSPNPFTDTSDRDVLRAYAAQITGGTSVNTFSPDANLTREMGATMLARAYKHAIYPGYTLSQDADFPLSYSRPAFFDDDSSISSYAYQSINFMHENDIIGGIGNNQFGPKNNMTREQALAIAVRMVDTLAIAQ